MSMVAPHWLLGEPAVLQGAAACWQEGLQPRAGLRLQPPAAEAAC